MDTNKKSSRGFTLIEMLVALMILSILVIAFSTLFVRSFQAIYTAGNKSQASYNAQAAIERRIAEKNANTVSDVKIEFSDDTSMSIEGGLVDVQRQEEDQKASMTAFLPVVPTITLNISELAEGYELPCLINVTGTDTNFNSGTTTLTITDKNGMAIVGSYGIEKITDKEHATIYLRTSLTSVNGPYLVTMKTGNEAASAVLNVYRIIKYAAVGSSRTITVSADGTSWIADNWGTPNTLYDIADNEEFFAAVGENGKIVKSAAVASGVRWVSVDLAEGNGYVLNGITWGNNRFVAVGYNANTAEGIILTTSDIDNWSKDNKNPIPGPFRLNAVAWGNNRFIAVGDNGIMLTSPDGHTWKQIESGVTENLKDIVWGNRGFVAVGSNGVILTSVNGEDWYPIEGNSITADINGVAYGNAYIAVGNNGLIITSDDGQNWTEKPSGTTNNLHDVSWGQNRYLAVGDSGSILQSTDNGNKWEALNSGTSSNLYGIAILSE